MARLPAVHRRDEAFRVGVGARRQFDEAVRQRQGGKVGRSIVGIHRTFAAIAALHGEGERGDAKRARAEVGIRGKLLLATPRGSSRRGKRVEPVETGGSEQTEVAASFGPGVMEDIFPGVRFLELHFPETPKTK